MPGPLVVGLRGRSPTSHEGNDYQGPERVLAALAARLAGK
jgi:hypothetical protein